MSEDDMLTAIAEEEQPQGPRLKPADRCDRCPAQAFVLVKGVAGELLFCGHHYAEHEVSLIKFAYEIVDDREWINKKPDSSA
ncbi:MAG: DUF7455 domain-containing protein [Candidatus Nanopelagicaceae bacterium]